MAEIPQRARRDPQLPIGAPTVLAVGMLLFAPGSHGLGFGPPQATAFIGSPLSFTLPLQLQPGEAFDPECVKVEVQVGERRLPPYALRWQVDSGGHANEPRVQVSTLGVLDEPVVVVQVSSGCTSSVSRRITLLSQWPGAAVSASSAGWALAEAAESPAHRVVSVPASRPSRGAVAARPRTSAGPDSLRLDRLLPPAAAATSAAVTVAALATPPLGPSTLLPSRGAVAMGAQAALTDAATQAADGQIRSLEQQVQQALTEARRQQDQLAQLRQRLVAAEAANAWLHWLLLCLGASSAMVCWLTLRVRRLQREVAHGHWSAAADAAQAVMPGDAGGVPLLSPGHAGLSRRQAALPLAPAPPAIVKGLSEAASAPAQRPVEVTVARTASEFSFGTGVPPRPVSVEELLDLDQQVDFFIVLGQEQAAIDLLLGHVRSTGGINALPYFKLLEIYREKGDDEAYERTRERFNQRFNAFAPAVDGDLMAGRTLEDYADVVLRLQRAWPQPLRAAAELESLLLRRADLEPFDLPAYREILMLHALVRDLPAGAMQPATTTALKVAATPPAKAALAVPQADADADAEVDLLLPLDDGSHDITVTHAQGSERVSAQSMLADWVFTRTTQPRPVGDDDTAAFPSLALDRLDGRISLDFDLSDVAPAPREFTRPAAFTDIDQRRDSRLSDLGPLDLEALPPIPRR